MTATTGRPKPRRPLLLPEDRWPMALWLPLGLVHVNEALLPAKPPILNDREQALRISRMREWTPALVIPRGSGFLVLDGCRRAREARRRGSTHLLAIVGKPDEPLLRQYEQLRLPRTERTIATWRQPAQARAS